MIPDPTPAASIDDLVERLRMLKVWAGDPSYETIKNQVNAAWTAQGRPAGELTGRSTVANCFQRGRRRLNTDLVVAVVEALHPDPGYVAQWRQALRAIGGEAEAVSQVRVHGSLPPELAGFTGRAGELDRLCRGGVATVAGMAGAGKTQLAVRAGHRLLRDGTADRVLFVNLRGFHPDPAQPPAEPGAVLDGFLRLLDTPGQQIPHGLAARTAAYRRRLDGTRTLVVLDNAATAEQVRPLLPDTPGCPVLVTSRHDLTGLHPTTRVTVGPFTPGEAATFLAGAVPDVPAGPAPDAVARIAARCGHLPLALSLVAGHIRGVSGWTLTDHADRLDERHRARRLDTGVELALDLSYRHLPADRQRMLRLAALHPGPDFDAGACAALTGSDPTAALGHLCRDHLLQPAGPGRYTFHDLVRAHATTRAHDHDPPADRRAALTRLFDHYVAAGAAATDPDWLDVERHSLVAVVAHAATHGWPRHAVRLARIMGDHLHGGHHADAEVVHGHAYHAARDTGDRAGQAHALVDLGHANMRLGRNRLAGDRFRAALDLFRQIDDPAGEAGALYKLAAIEDRSGRLPAAIDLNQRAVVLYRRAGDPTGEAKALGNIGVSLVRAGRPDEAAGYFTQTLELARRVGHPYSEALARHGLGDIEVLSGRYEAAGAHLRQALALYRKVGDRTSEAGLLESLGTLHTRAGRLDEAVDCCRLAAACFREIGMPDGEAWALNGLGEATLAAGHSADAVTHHTAALTIATGIGAVDQQARAHAGLGRALDDGARAREHYERAAALYTELGVPEADEIRERLAG